MAHPVLLVLMNKNFASLALKPDILNTLKDLKFDKMTLIQEKSLPYILQGKDVVAQAKTGSGKTAAFGLGILNSLNIEKTTSVHSLILCPTRELADQVGADLRTLARNLKNVKILSLCGGVSESSQERALKSSPHIVVGTPGRILKLLKKDVLNLSQLRILTLDEADRMLDMGFEDELTQITELLPSNRQSLLFSATYPEDILTLSKNIQKDAIHIKVDVSIAADHLHETFYKIETSDDKNGLLYKLLSVHRPERMIVFCRTKKDTEDVADFLVTRKIHADFIHGDLEQNQRTAVLTKFVNHSLNILVATDVAARGLDIEDLPAVLNYDLPSDPESYIHRVGRTGRAGKKGMAITFFDAKEEEKLRSFEQMAQRKFIFKSTEDLNYSQGYDLVPLMQTIYISGGKKDKIRPGDIVGALIAEAQLKAEDIGQIHILNSFSYVAIKTSKVQQAVAGLRTGKVKKKRFKVGIASTHSR